MTPVLSVENVWKRYNGHGEPVVRGGASFHLLSGEILALLGPSGCGKTTTLRVIAGFERAQEGTVKLNGRVLGGPGLHVRPEKRGIGFVFQEYALFPHLDVLGNIMFGLKHLRRRERRVRAEELLRLVGLTGYGHRGAHELSGGQQQRVALARTLAAAPEVILLDEPFSNLDAALRSETRAEVRRILKETGMSAVLVTHDQEEALTVADRIAVMNGGRIEQVGDPQSIYRRPATPLVARFLGITNLVKGEAKGCCALTDLGLLPMVEHLDNGPVLLSIRPEQFSIECTADTDAPGIIVAREFKGHDQYYRVRWGSREFYVMTDHRSDYAEGQRCILRTTEPVVVLSNENGVATASIIRD